MASQYFSSPFLRDGSKGQGVGGPSDCPSFCPRCGWPASCGAKPEGDCEHLCSMALPLFLWSIQAGSRKQKHSQEESCEAPKLADLFWLPFLFSPEHHHIRGDVVLNPQGLGCLPESFLLQLHRWQIHAQGDNGLDEAICQSLELGIRYLTATSV